MLGLPHPMCKLTAAYEATNLGSSHEEEATPSKHHAHVLHNSLLLTLAAPKPACSKIKLKSEFLKQP